MLVEVKMGKKYTGAKALLCLHCKQTGQKHIFIKKYC